MAFISIVRFFVMIFALVLIVIEFFAIRRKFEAKKVFIIRIFGTLLMAAAFLGMVFFRITHLYGYGMVARSFFSISVVVVLAFVMIILSIVDYCIDKGKV